MALTPAPRPNCSLSDLVEEDGRHQCYGHGDGVGCPWGLHMYGEYEREQRARLLGIVAFLLILGGLILLAGVRCG